MTIYDVLVEEMSGLESNLQQYKDKVILIVNTASKCGYTPQLQELQELYNKYKDLGLVVLAFPSGQFLNQELDTNDQIIDFYQANYGVSFPTFAKIKVRGRKRAPIFKYLVENTPIRHNKKVRWNFEKFLIDREGNIVNRYLPKVTPKEIESEIIYYLG